MHFTKCWLFTNFAMDYQLRKRNNKVPGLNIGTWKSILISSSPFLFSNNHTVHILPSQKFYPDKENTFHTTTSLTTISFSADFKRRTDLTHFSVHITQDYTECRTWLQYCIWCVPINEKKNNSVWMRDSKLKRDTGRDSGSIRKNRNGHLYYFLSLIDHFFFS